MNICIYGAASDLIDSSYLLAGEKLGEALAKKGYKIVYGGGSEGMMGAVARGSKSNGGYLIGISPSFFKVDGDLYDNCDEFIYTETMRERKKLLEDKSDAFIVTPGGFGTFDEFFEVIALRQLKRHTKPILLYNLNGYFNPLIEMLQSAVKQNFIKKQSMELFGVCDTPEDAIKYFEQYENSDDKISDYR